MILRELIFFWKKRREAIAMPNYDLVIVGGGSAGIACAISAFDHGVSKILILEKDLYLGGILLQCIHNGFGLTKYKEELTGPEYADRYIKELKKRAIDFKVKTMVLKITENLQVQFSNAIDGFQTVQARAIVMATGCSERTRGAINLSGDRVPGVLTAGLAQRYLNIDGYMVGKRVFILGSGDIGLIMARRMTLEGAKVLGVAEIMPYSNGLTRNIVQCLHDYDIPLYLHHTVKRVIGREHLEKIIVSKVDDNLQFIPGTDREFEVDTLLLSVGLIPSIPLVENIGVKVHPKTKGPIVDESMMTNIPGIFACGNALHVHDLVDFVSLEAEKTGEKVAKFLKDENAKSNREMNVVPKTGINYILPCQVNLDNTESITFNFRVNQPFSNVYLRILLNGKEIKKVKKAFMLPAEMETIELPSAVLEAGILEMEVANA